MTNPEKNLSLEILREIISYNPSTGIFTWKMKIGRSSAGDVAGSYDKDGYIIITIDGVRYRAHRLAWFYINGYWPSRQIDHENTVKNDNRFNNLREATNSQNNANAGLSRRNRSGFKGVRWHPCGKWLASISCRGKCVHLGVYDSREKARAVYLSAAKVLFGKFARAA